MTDNSGGSENEESNEDGSSDGQEQEMVAVEVPHYDVFEGSEPLKVYGDAVIVTDGTPVDLTAQESTEDA